MELSAVSASQDCQHGCQNKESIHSSYNVFNVGKQKLFFSFQDMILLSETFFISEPVISHTDDEPYLLESNPLSQP
jgi:hypothetical protein